MNAPRARNRARRPKPAAGPSVFMEGRIRHPEIPMLRRICGACRWQCKWKCGHPAQVNITPLMPWSYARKDVWDGEHFKCGMEGVLWEPRPPTLGERVMGKIRHALHGPDHQGGFGRKLRELVKGPDARKAVTECGLVAPHVVSVGEVEPRAAERDAKIKRAGLVRGVDEYWEEKR